MINSIENSYYPTVRELLSFPILSTSKLIAGEGGLDRIVTDVTQSDSPDYVDYLSPNELVITTFYAISQNPSAMLKCIPEMVRANTAGLFIKPTWMPGGKVPESMIHKANELDYPIVELSSELRFSAVGHALSDELTKRRTALLNNTLYTNRILNEVIIEGASLDEITQMISKMCQVSLLIIDTMNGRQCYFESENDKEQFTGMQNAEVINLLTSKSQMYEIKSGKHVYGFLYLYDPKHNSLISKELLEQIMSAISLEISREQHSRAAEGRIFSSYIMHLITDPIIDEQAEYQRAKGFQMDLDEKHALMRIKLETQKSNSKIYMNALHRTLLLNKLNTIIVKPGISAKIIDLDTGFLILITFDENGPSFSSEQAAAKLTQMINSFTAEYPEFSITAGIGRSYRGIHGLIQSDKEAKTALKVAKASGHVCEDYNNLGLLRLIYCENAKTEMSEFTSEMLGDLLELDKTGNSELINTLDCYIRNFGNVKRMSEEMFTHYNTVSYRIRNIQKITGRDLHDPADYYLICTAMQLYHYMKEN